MAGGCKTQMVSIKGLSLNDKLGPLPGAWCLVPGASSYNSCYITTMRGHKYTLEPLHSILMSNALQHF